MPRFRFRLQPVLDQRIAQERVCQLGVARLEVIRTQLEDRLRRLAAMIAQERDEMRRELIGDRPGVTASRVDVRGVRMQAGASVRLSANADRTVLELAGLHKRLEAARRELLEAATRRKAVETLRERQREAWDHEQRRRENAELDELYMMRAARVLAVSAGTPNASDAGDTA